MPTTPKLTIVTAVLSNSAGLERTAHSLAGVLDSSLQWEWLWIDSSPRMHEKLYQKLVIQNFPIVRKKLLPLGIYPAMNAGIEYAQGEIIWFLHANDCLEDYAILIDALLRLESDPKLKVICAAAKMKRGTKLIFTNYPKPLFTETLLSGRFPCQQAMLYRKDVFDIVGNFDVRLEVAADYEHHLRLLHFKIPAQCINSILVSYDLEGFSSVHPNRNRELATIRRLFLPELAGFGKRVQLGCLGTLDALRFNLKQSLTHYSWFPLLQSLFSKWKNFSYRFS